MHRPLSYRLHIEIRFNYRALINKLCSLDADEEAAMSFQHIFYGRLLQEVTCYGCSVVSFTFPDFVDLSVDIIGMDSIEKAISNYFEPKIIGDIGKKSSLYKCNACKKNVLATSKNFIETAPAVLCIHLKRFQTFGENTGYMKINDKIFLSREIKIDQYFEDKHQKELKYDLRSMIIHEGHSPYSGHYTAVGEGKMDHFYEFNDAEKVTTVSAEKLLLSSSCVIFYEMSPKSWSTYVPPDKAATHLNGSTLGHKKSVDSAQRPPAQRPPAQNPPAQRPPTQQPLYQRPPVQTRLPSCSTNASKNPDLPMDTSMPINTAANSHLMGNVDHFGRFELFFLNFFSKY